MTAERWRRVEDVYHAALMRDEATRAAFLAEACGGDEELRQEVESLLNRRFFLRRSIRIRGMTWSVDGRSVIVGQERASSDIVLFD